MSQRKTKLDGDNPRLNLAFTRVITRYRMANKSIMNIQRGDIYQNKCGVWCLLQMLLVFQ